MYRIHQRHCVFVPGNAAYVMLHSVGVIMHEQPVGNGLFARRCPAERDGLPVLPYFCFQVSRQVWIRIDSDGFFNICTYLQVMCVEGLNDEIILGICRQIERDLNTRTSVPTDELFVFIRSPVQAVKDLVSRGHVFGFYLYIEPSGPVHSPYVYVVQVIVMVLVVGSDFPNVPA